MELLTTVTIKTKINESAMDFTTLAQLKMRSQSELEEMTKLSFIAALNHIGAIEKLNYESSWAEVEVLP